MLSVFDCDPPQNPNPVPSSGLGLRSGGVDAGLIYAGYQHRMVTVKDGTTPPVENRVKREGVNDGVVWCGCV